MGRRLRGRRAHNRRYRAPGGRRSFPDPPQNLRTRHEDTLAQRGPAESYLRRPNRLGIQNWRMASTTVGMLRHASRAKDGVLRPCRWVSRTRRSEGCTPTVPENDIRCQVTKREISDGTRSDAGRDCRDAFLGLLKTCAKNGFAFWDYLGARLAVPGCQDIPDLAQIARALAPTPP